MIIRNLVVGTDRNGHKLCCGDVCKDNSTGEKVMLMYNSIQMRVVGRTIGGTMVDVKSIMLEKLFDGNSENFNSLPDGKEWEELYKEELMKEK